MRACVCVYVCMDMCMSCFVHMHVHVAINLRPTSYGDMSVTAIACPVLCCCFMRLPKREREQREKERGGIEREG